MSPPMRRVTGGYSALLMTLNSSLGGLLIPRFHVVDYVAMFMGVLMRP